MAQASSLRTLAYAQAKWCAICEESQSPSEVGIGMHLLSRNSLEDVFALDNSLSWKERVDGYNFTSRTRSPRRTELLLLAGADGFI